MDRADRALSHPRIATVRAALAAEGKEVGGLVACHTSRDDAPAQRARTLGLSPLPVFEGPRCSLSLRAHLAAPEPRAHCLAGRGAAPAVLRTDTTA